MIRDSVDRSRCHSQRPPSGRSESIRHICLSGATLDSRSDLGAAGNDNPGEGDQTDSAFAGSIRWNGSFCRDSGPSRDDPSRRANRPIEASEAAVCYDRSTSDCGRSIGDDRRVGIRPLETFPLFGPRFVGLQWKGLPSLATRAGAAARAYGHAWARHCEASTGENDLAFKR